MVELILYNYLSQNLPDPEAPLRQIPVFTEVPARCPNKFVVIEKTGSRNNDHIETAVIAIRSYAPTLYKAAQLNEAVKSAVEGSVASSAISAAKLNSDYNFTSREQKQPRYQAVFEITSF